MLFSHKKATISRYVLSTVYILPAAYVLFSGKYLTGITDVAAEDVQVEIVYSQDVITPIENMVFKCTKVVNMEPDGWYTGRT